jgi:hypothetical protein
MMVAAIRGSAKDLANWRSDLKNYELDLEEEEY